IIQDSNMVTLVIGNQQNPKYTYKFLKNPRKIIIITPSSTQEINIKKEMYIVLQTHVIEHQLLGNYKSLCFFYEIKCYVYNKYDKTFFSIPQLVHYIGVTKF
ncbi:MAG: hypothetical protein N2169_04285, partial [bacterium]|nr:hypothetical protein [bacterium]